MLALGPTCYGYLLFSLHHAARRPILRSPTRKSPSSLWSFNSPASHERCSVFLLSLEPQKVTLFSVDLLPLLLLLLVCLFVRPELSSPVEHCRPRAIGSSSYPMQLSVLHRRKQTPNFHDHTLKDVETTVSDPWSSFNMFGVEGLPFAAGALYTNAIMGHTPSALEREKARKASSTILREDLIVVEESEDIIPTPDSFSLHHVCTTQAPYSTSANGETTTDGQRLTHADPPNEHTNSYDLAIFLRETGPTELHRKPSKADRPKRAVSASRHALRFFRLGGTKRPPPPVSVTDAHHE